MIGNKLIGNAYLINDILETKFPTSKTSDQPQTDTIEKDVADILLYLFDNNDSIGSSSLVVDNIQTEQEFDKEILRRSSDSIDDNQRESDWHPCNLDLPGVCQPLTFLRACESF